MRYLLDTNTAILFINGRSLRVKERILATAPEEMVLCSIVVAELLAGAAKSNSPERSLTKQLRFTSRFVSLPFDDASAAFYAEIRASLEKKGTPVGANDLLIAAIGAQYGLTVVTTNTSEFQRVPNLLIEDWSRA